MGRVLLICSNQGLFGKAYIKANWTNYSFLGPGLKNPFLGSPILTFAVRGRLSGSDLINMAVTFFSEYGFFFKEHYGKSFLCADIKFRSRTCFSSCIFTPH